MDSARFIFAKFWDSGDKCPDCDQASCKAITLTSDRLLGRDIEQRHDLITNALGVNSSDQRAQKCENWLYSQPLICFV